MATPSSRSPAAGTAFQALWEPNGVIHEELERIKRQLLGETDLAPDEINHLRSRLNGIEFVRRAMEPVEARQPQRNPVQRTEKPSFIKSLFLPRPLGG